MNEDILKVKYCTHCGNPVDPVTKKCQGCGKQYFKGIPWKQLITTLINLLLVTSLVTNFILYKVCKEFTLEISELSAKQATIQANKLKTEIELRDCYSQFDKLRRLVVFVEDDNTKQYHRFQCDKFVKENFQAYIVDTAKSKGYKPCPLCHNASGKIELNFNEEVNYLLIADAVGDDYEISISELNKLPAREYSWLMYDDVVFICNTWKGLYHSVSCERLTDTCNVTIKSFAQKEGFVPCPICQE